MLQDRVYNTRIRDVDHLRERLVEEWARFNQNIIDSAINEWRERLRACVRACGGHFEQLLSTASSGHHRVVGSFQSYTK